ncbi:MAG: NlpC/P60 family peptidoglycan endopeptidase RipA [Candidatus Sericytochromatia bacterium]
MTSSRHSVCAAAVAVGLLLSTPAVGAAEPAPAGSNDVATLIAAVANANQRLQEIGASVQSRQEAVNKAIVYVQTARDQAEAAKAEVAASQRAVQDANAAIAAAQQRFDTYAATAYINGTSASYLTATTPEDFIATASAGETLAISAKQTLESLLRARTEQVNKESAARAAQERADQAAADAQRSQDEAVAALTDAQHQFGEQKAQIDRLAAERDAAKTRLQAAQAQWSTQAATVPPAPNGRAPSAPAPGDRWDSANTPAAQPNPKNWDTTVWDPILPAIPSAFVSGDPIAIINAVLGIAATSSQVTADLGRNFLIKMGLITPTQPDTGITNGRIPRVYGSQAVEYVIRRGMSQIGVPYSWGGGTAAGPSVGQGDDTIGFDCSGLVLYSFAGVGIKLPHYSGAQYDMGRKIPSAQMERGDVIFYGPGGSQHVTIYLGNGQMLEAQQSGVPVKVSPVRTSGMTPYVVRYIEH